MKRLLTEQQKKRQKAFFDRMSDFQFEVIKAEDVEKPEEPQEQKPEPKKYDEFRQILDHDD